MTKKEQIAEAALDLFAKTGIEGTSTRAIAQQAEVSEALIFRHYTNKKGLVEFLLESLEQELINLLEPWKILEPKEQVKQLMELPFSIPAHLLPYLKFYYKLSWSNLSSSRDPFDALLAYLTEALRSLGFAQPDVEAEITLAYVHGFAFSALNKKFNNTAQGLKSLRTKYA